MKFKVLKLAYSLFLFIFILANAAKSENIKNFEFFGNNRIPDETILMLAKIKKDDYINEEKLNEILINLYNSNFFKDVKISFTNNILKIQLVENPLIDQITFEGIKAKKNLEIIKSNLFLKPRSSYTDTFAKNDLLKIKSNLKEIGYYFATVDVFVEELNDNRINLNYKIDLGNKAKIKKITFIGDKKYKDSKLKSIIISEEYKFWKFISGKKYLNENLIEFDKRLLKNFYLNKGYYDVSINSSFAKLLAPDEFEIIYNINANNKFFFNNLKLKLPVDYNSDNFNRIDKLFNNLKGESYSLNSVRDIIEEIETIVLNEQFEATKTTVNEEFDNNQINLTFIIKETEKFTVEKINIYGNNITQESVIRNNLSIDEGDIYNDLLTKKSENNLKGMGIFGNVVTKVKEGSNAQTKIIEIDIEEKPTGEIMAGAGFGTSGSSFTFGVKENNYLGRGIKFDTNFLISEDSIKGQVNMTNPNFKNSDKSLSLNIQSLETDRLSDFGYKTNKNGISLSTNFEYLRNLNLGVGGSSFYEKIETDSTASARQKKMKGEYWDTFTQLSFDYDKRNQKFKTSKGFRSFYTLDLPIISKTNTLTNRYSFKHYTELYEENITTTSLLIKTANSLTNDDIKLSERLFVPSNRLRGFEFGKVGPKDGKDFVGGNFLTALNFNSTIPQLFPNAQNFDFLFFLDIANVWGVDYDSSLDKNNNIRSSAGIAIDWMTPVGPLNFSLAQPLSKSSGDITESFRFNLGTTF